MSSKLSISYSKLTCFEQCPLKFDYLYVTKSIRDLGNEYTQYGTRVHESLEQYAKSKDPKYITVETRNFKSLVDKVLMEKGEKFFEYKMSVDHNKAPCAWDDENVWLRGIADVLVLRDEVAICLDWKTGKPRNDPTQLAFFACLVMFSFPEINEVRTSFLWLHHNCTSDATYKRDKLESVWSPINERISKLQESVDLGVMNPRPGPLCKWCAAKNICAYA